MTKAMWWVVEFEEDIDAASIGDSRRTVTQYNWGQYTVLRGNANGPDSITYMASALYKSAVYHCSSGLRLSGLSLQRIMPTDGTGSCVFTSSFFPFLLFQSPGVRRGGYK